MTEAFEELTPEEEYTEAKKSAWKYGGSEHIALLSQVYGFRSRAEAEELLKEDNVPFEERRLARAYLTQLTAKPKVVDKRPVWKRQRRR